MFRAVPTQVPHYMQAPQSMPHGVYSPTNPMDAAMYQSLGATTADGRPVMYYVPSTAAAAGGASMTPPSWPVMGAPVAAKPSNNNSSSSYLSPTWVAGGAYPAGSGTPPAKEPRRTSPTGAVPPPYATEKANTSTTTTTTAAAAEASASTCSTLLRPAGQSVNGISLASAMDASTTSNTSASVSTHLDANKSSATTATAAAPVPTPATCFILDSATGAMRAMTADEFAAAAAAGMVPRSPTVPSYAFATAAQQQQQPHTLPPPPHPSVHSTAARSAGGGVPATAAESFASSSYALTHPVSFNNSLGSIFSASLSGTVPYMPVVAIAHPSTLLPPPPPPAPKMMNGLQYQHGELYEGFVKRYNPNRGFGFLTATYHVLPVSPATAAVAGSVNGNSSSTSTPSPAASLTTASATATAAVKERRVPVHLGDIFVHQSYMHMQGFRTLPVGGRVRFRVGYKDGQQTFQAVDVELLPQVLPQSMEASTTTPTTTMAPASLPLEGEGAAGGAVATVASSSAASHSSAAAHSHNGSFPQHPGMTQTEYERVIGTIGSPVGSGGSNSEQGREFFAVPKKTPSAGNALVPGLLVEHDDDEDEDDVPLFELAFDVYNSLEG